jgi:peptidoglycan/LPS O-acetylase OafA/YrhL/outer membrane biosynthesis protein TonB
VRDQTDGKAGVARPYFRGDIEGLRGISILFVLLFHAKIAGFNGGFVGVDVFFVISGFLITGLLLREVEQTGRISISQFYARRARRLLPAAALVLITTLLVSYLLLPSLLIPGIAIDTAAAALYVSNINFAYHATDYFASTTVPSPILHFWSLSVEEQYYMFWPAIVLLVTRKARRPRINIRIALLIIGIASFALALWLLRSNAPWAFFSLPTRAWELALGGLLAVSRTSLERIPRLAARTLGWVGVTGVIVSGLLMKENAPFPGVPALLPTISAALVIIAGMQAIRSIPTRLLQITPLRFFGRISYSLYLWHWPVLVIPAALSLTPLTLTQRILLAGGAIGLAALTQRFIEDPIRKGRVIGIRPRWNLAAAMAVAMAVTGTAYAINTNINSHIRGTTSTASADQNAQRLDSILSTTVKTPAATTTALAIPTQSATATPSAKAIRSPTPSATPKPKVTASAKPTPKPNPKTVKKSTSSPSASPTSTAPSTSNVSATPSASPTATTSPTPSATPSATTQSPDASASATSGTTPSASSTATPTASATPQATAVGGRATSIDFRVPSNIAPSLATAKTDRALSYNDGCHTKEDMKPSTKPCLYGNLKETKTIVLFGDSHALSWDPAIVQAAKSHGWKMLSLTMSACTPADIPAWNPTMNAVMKNCSIWRKTAIAKIIAAKPYIVVIAGTRGFATIDASGKLLSGAKRTAAYDAGMKRTIDKIKTTAKHVILMEDTPASMFDPPVCLATHRSSTLACSTPVEKAISSSWQSEEHTLAADESIGIIDPSFWVCPTAPCPVVIGNLLVYMDPGHLTATFSAALSRRMGSAITAAIR